LHNPRFNGKGPDTPVTTSDARMNPNDAFGGVYEEFGRLYEAQHVLSVKDVIQIIRRRLWVIVLIPLVLAGLAAGLSWAQTPTYQASVTLLVAPQQAAPEAAGDLQSEALGVQQLMPTITEMITTRPVAQDVIRRLDLSMSPVYLQGGLSVEQGSESQFIYISYEDPNPERARLIANTVADVVSERIPEINLGVSAVEARVWERAELPRFPEGSPLVRNSFLMLVLGLMLGAGLAFLLDYLDDRWKSSDEAEQVLGVPTFGVIPSFKVRSKKRKPSQRLAAPPAKPPGSHE
jgi:capsular polysaccharide biosynthesis protein